MDITRTTPFIQGVRHVFETMLQLPVEVFEPRWMDAGAEPLGVAVVAEVSGACGGCVVLGFDVEAAERVVALLTGSEMSSDSPDFADAASELLDMVCGAAKSWLPGDGVAFSIPIVERGASPLAAWARNRAPVVAVPCATDCGQFVIGLSLEDAAQTADLGARAVCAVAERPSRGETR